MYEEFDSFKNSTPSFFTENSRHHSASRLKENKENSASVANCIRALTHKTSMLVKENSELREKLRQVNEELQSFKQHHSECSSYKEKCLILEQSSDLFQKKLSKLEEITGFYDGLKGEMLLLNKELTREIEKNQKLILENNKLKDKTVCLENSYQDISEMLRKTTARKDSFDDYRLKGTEDNLKLLESLLDKQQSELESKRNMVEVLKGKLSNFEDTVFELKKEKHKCELQVQEVNEMNERLLRALKKKNHVCRHRASTPDIMGIPVMGQSQANLSVNRY